MTAAIPTVTIAEAGERTVVRLEGRISQIEIGPLEGPIQVVARVDDGSGVIDAVFMGRRLIPGVEPGRRIAVEGRIVSDEAVARIYNPKYELL